MASGGARNRSGPSPSATSGRSDRRGIRFAALPAGGYNGETPTFPLPTRWISTTSYVDGAKIVDDDDAATEQVARREHELWAWAWTTPQACAWAMPSESWRLYTIAMWVRTYVLCESSEATAADKSSLHRFADQIGLTPAGLKENGWAVAKDEVAAKAAEKSEAASAQPARRLRAVPGA